MLNGLAENEDNALGNQRRKRGVNLGYNIVFSGGERTLEKDIRNIDL
jgi:hypothetical protein